MLLGSSINRPKVNNNNALKMSGSTNTTFLEPQQYKQNRTIYTNSTYPSADSSTGLPSVIQCYSVSTGKVSTLLRSPSQSSISSIEVAEINHLSEFRNTSNPDRITAIDSLSRYVINQPTCEKSSLLSDALDVEHHELSPSSNVKKWPLICIQNELKKR